MCSKVLNGHIILTDTSITTILAPEMTYTPQIFRIAAFLQNEKWSVCVRAYYFAFSGYDILVEPYYKNALPIVGWDNLSTFVLLG